jgi:hypothetical protein
MNDMGIEMIEDFRSYREKMNEKLLSQDNKVIKRIFNLDTNAYMDGALTARAKEMLGLGGVNKKRRMRIGYFTSGIS